MGSNAFDSLHALPGVFSAVQVSSLTSANEIQQYLASIDAVRQQLLDSLEKTQLEKVVALVKVPLPDFFIDCAAIITISSALQRALSNRLQNSSAAGGRNGGLPQEETHLLVDLWGQVEASRALFEFVLRQTDQALAGAIKAESLRAQYRVLLGGVERLILEVGTQYGERLTVAEAAIAIDWSLARVRNGAYSPISDAVDTELSGLSV